jgi:uncharacterized protein YabN with tetrapyrrole methylase and pyrophosphatase domain
MALDAAAGRFAQRLLAVQDALDDEGKRMDKCSLDELDVYWERAKERDRLGPSRG